MTSPVNSCYPVSPIAETPVNPTPKQAAPNAPANSETLDTVQISRAARDALASTGDIDLDGDGR